MSFNAYYIRTDDFTTGTGGGGADVITRDNYEAYFVMYVDNELDGAGREAVEQFIQQNPDLEEELAMLQQSVLQPDEQIVFKQKEKLFKHTPDQGLVNEHNYEEYFVLYGDDELTNDEKDKVEFFVYKHPQYQEAFELIQQAKLMPDQTLTFPEKAYLYRTEEDDNKVVAFPWWRISAAAIALLVIGSMVWYASIQNAHTEVAGRMKTKTKQPGTQKTNPPQPAVKNNNEASKATTDKTIPSVQMPVNASEYGGVVRENKKQPAHQQVALNSSTQKNISKQRNIQPAINVTPKNTEQPVKEEIAKDKEISAKPVNVAIASSYTKPAVNSIKMHKKVDEQLAFNTVAAVAADEASDKAPTYVLNTSINKTPLRGFFRKVSRVVDKVTSGDENSKGGVRIANLSIALK